MCKSVEHSTHDVRDFVNRNFYVDDGLVPTPDADLAAELISKTKFALSEGGNLRLHKIVSNDKNLLSKFQSSDLAEGLKNLDLASDSAPLQNSLSLLWDINTDIFTYTFSGVEKPFTKRGILSTINSLFDPMGFIAPIIIQGKLFLREVTSLNHDWDEPLPESYSNRWTLWKQSLSELRTVNIPRMYAHVSLSQAKRVELHVFSDASKEAVGAVSYLNVFDINNVSKVCFLLGKAKVAPWHGHTIPPLELCAAVLAVEVSNLVLEHIDASLEQIHFYTDSKNILGYIHNEKRRFHVYVSNRVD